MIIVRLWGGLGNQMFQYAFGYAMAKKYSSSLILDTTFFDDKYLKKNKRFTKQKLQITELPIAFKKECRNGERTIIVCLLQRKNISRLIRIFPEIKIPINKRTLYIKETRLKYMQILLKKNFENLYFDGYWQSEKYFLEFKNDLKIQFDIKSSKADALMKKYNLLENNVISIHVRLGDYSKYKTFSRSQNTVLKSEYYFEAIKKASELIYNPVFLICSNDINESKRLLGEKSNFIYVDCFDNIDVHDEFKMMSLCRNHIISNSTFSWWAAWLNDDKGENFAPNIFFGNENIIPESWNKIEI